MPVRDATHVVAFSDFATRRSPALFRTAYLLLGDHQLAQDLLQEALVKTYCAWPRLREQSSAEAYARRCLVTTAISWRRRRSFHERPAAAERAPRPAASPDPVESLAEHDVMWAALGTLPSRQRAAIVLRYYEDLSEARTAGLMGCSVGTVKSQVSTGLARLRERLGPGVGAAADPTRTVTP
jgi:RNA polymerase sigma-70 factor (sigma-E family)